MATSNRVEADADPQGGRDETDNERLDRNWNELLQELRVTQTGTQILTGFLLAVAFQPRIDSLSDFDHRTCSAGTRRRSSCVRDT